MVILPKKVLSLAKYIKSNFVMEQEQFNTEDKELNEQSQIEVDAEAKKEKNTKRGVFPTWFDLLAILGIFFVVQLITQVAISLMGCEMISNEEIAAAATVAKRTMEFEMGRTTLFYALISQPLVLLLVVIYRQIRGGEWKIINYSIRGFNPTILLWGFIMLLAIAVVIEPIMQLLPQIKAPAGRGIYMLMALLIVAPLFEELLCRGVILEAIRRKYNGWIACLASSLIFGFMHLQPQAVLNAFTIGLLLGYLYIRTNSIFAPMILHLFNNVIAYLFLVFGLSGTTLNSLIANKTIYNVVYGISIGVVVLSIIAISQQINHLDNKKKVGNISDPT